MRGLLNGREDLWLNVQCEVGSPTAVRQVEPMQSLCIGALDGKGYAANGSAAMGAGLKQKSAWPALTTWSGNTLERQSRAASSD